MQAVLLIAKVPQVAANFWAIASSAGLARSRPQSPVQQLKQSTSPQVAVVLRSCGFRIKCSTMVWHSPRPPFTATTPLQSKWLRTPFITPKQSTLKSVITSSVTSLKKEESHFTTFQLLNNWLTSSPKLWMNIQTPTWSLSLECWISNPKIVKLMKNVVYFCLLFFSDIHDSVSLTRHWRNVKHLCRWEWYVPDHFTCTNPFLTLSLHSETNESVCNTPHRWSFDKSMPMGMLRTGSYYTHLSTLTLISLLQKQMIQCDIPHSDEALKILCRWTYTEPCMLHAPILSKPIYQRFMIQSDKPHSDEILKIYADGCTPYRSTSHASFISQHQFL